MNKTLVTHINPHLDDIAAIWLIKRFFSEFKGAKIEFISAEKGESGVSDDDNTLHIGVGRGKYDEHKGDIGESAMSLVWLDIKKRGLAPKNKFEVQAYERAVKWNTLIDTARLPYWEYDDFDIDNFIRSFKNDAKDSLKTVKLGEEILDRIYPSLVKTFQGLADWEKRIEFKSKWGKVVAIESASFGRSYAYKMGFAVVIVSHNKGGRFIGITAPGTSDLDLTPIYVKLTQIEPAVGWFLHHGKKMILCGAASAPEVVRSKLTLPEVIEIVKSIK